MTTITWRYRGGVTVRAVAAIGGGYVFTSIASALIALALPMSRADAVTTATLLSFVVYTCIILWVFATSSALRACVGVIASSAVLGALLWFVGRTA
ncbi:DUF3649 domain-containing protein [Massilia aurea]|uniref:DUF3649 domain-containing protein n=1 Tax=Massilia aurea TaxID=373040 RepID=UPI003461E95A